eukprot:14579357-Alexandrium_andersonii.AAC.1
MSASLVGSEMCIRDRPAQVWEGHAAEQLVVLAWCSNFTGLSVLGALRKACLLYTSDAADDM